VSESEIERIPYDEFGLFHENAEEFGLPYDGPPVVRRERVELGDGRGLSALVWGDEPAEVVFFHGGAQNAHTWDTVVMALGRPVLCVDLPGHGHSDGGRQGSFDLDANADDLAVAVQRFAPGARLQVGMSLGGMTSIAFAARHPELVQQLLLVDVTPGVNEGKAKDIAAFINGPESFPSFHEILERTVQFNPTRSELSLRRGILHNAEQQEDGSWVWRYQRFRSQEASEPLYDRTDLWDALEHLQVPVVLARGMRKGSVVDDDDVVEVLRRQPSARIVQFDGSGHSIQGDQPLELAALVEELVAD
jgi:pimeloyl-ACP methyl ester carboxylesterase